MKLGQTDLVHNVTVRIFGGTDMSIGGTDFIRVRACRNLGETNYTNSMGPVAHLGLTKTL